MAYQAIGLGTVANDGTGDGARAGGTKINANFVELYTALGDGSTLAVPETVQDLVGGMVTGNTETLITVTYQDADGTLDFAVEANLSNYTNDAGFITDVTGDNLGDLADVTITTIASGELLKWNGSAWINNTLAEAGIAAASHAHATSDITSGTFADARIAESNVTQHEAALTITESQISDLGTYQPLDAGLTSIAGLTTAADRMIYTTASDTYAVATLTSAARSILDDASTAAIRTTLGVGTGQSPQFTAVNIGNATDTTVARVSAGQISVEGVQVATISNSVTLTNKTIDTASNTITVVEADISDLGSYITDVVSDTTPQLGGMLDVNGNALGDGTRELLTFTEDASAVNHVNIENEATGGGPIISAAGDDTNIDLILNAKGSGNIHLGVFELDADQTVGAGQDNYVLTYDDASGTISLEAAPGAGGGISNVVEDTTPQLGGDLDANTNNIGFDDATGITDDSGNEQLIFQSTASAVNYVEITNAATGNGPSLTAAGGDTNIDLALGAKGTGRVTVDRVQGTHVYNAQTGTTYTLAAADQDAVVTMSNASANTLTIPTNASVAFPTGTIVTIFALGAGTTTIAGDTGVTLSGNGGTASAGSCDIQTQYNAATIIKIGTNSWLVSGDIDAVA